VVTPADGWRVYGQGVVSNVLNPKVAIFFLAFLPQFVDLGAGRGPVPFLFLGTIFVIGGTLWSLGQAVGAAGVARAMRGNPIVLQWLQRLSGCVYIALGLNLLRARPQAASD
jgi:threonine/homoserine/homoserine lactone efflux protein